MTGPYDARAGGAAGIRAASAIRLARGCCPTRYETKRLPQLGGLLRFYSKRQRVVRLAWHQTRRLVNGTWARSSW